MPERGAVSFVNGFVDTPSATGVSFSGQHQKISCNGPPFTVWVFWVRSLTRRDE